MRLRIALDERMKRDKEIQVKGIPFVFDPFTAALLREPITVYYDDVEDSFRVAFTSYEGDLC